MQSQDYISSAKKTESTDFAPIRERLSSEKMLRLLHGAIGVSTEAGEILDAVKKHAYYGKALDEVNLVEELGGLFWYMAIMADELGVDFESIMAKNLLKLQARYQGKFSSDRAMKRDLEEEKAWLML
jgi:NTP pyrophosphatase (non-canonical NTP hydrolase)